HKVFRIDNDQVLNLLGLQPRAGFRYSLNEIGPKIKELTKQANQASKVKAGERDLFARKVVELAEHVQLYIQLSRQETPLAVPPQSANGEWKSYADVENQAKEM